MMILNSIMVGMVFRVAPALFCSVSLRQSLNQSKTFLSLYDGVANDYLTVTLVLKKIKKIA